MGKSQIKCQVQIYGRTSNNIFMKKVKDSRPSVRYKKIKTYKHRAVLGLKHRGDDDAWM